MKVNFYQPGPGFDWLVRQYEQIEGRAIAPISDKHIPRGDSAFVFNLYGQAIVKDRENLRLPARFITTIQPISSTLEISGNVSSFIVVCHTSILTRIMNIDLRKHQGQYFVELTGKPYQQLWNDLRKAPDPHSRIGVFEGFLAKKMQMKYDYDAIDNAYLDILRSDPNKHLSKIVANAGVSDRFLRRHFLKRVGVSPKTLARIVRVHSVFQKITTQTPRDFMQMVCEFRYCDQSHFIHDFRSVVGESPLKFYRRNLERVKYLSGVS